MSTATASKSKELEGDVVDVARQLLEAGGRDAEVLAVIQKLVARNAELERELSERRRRANVSERQASGQLRLFAVKAAEIATDAEIQSETMALEDAAKSELESQRKQREAAASRDKKKGRPNHGDREIPVGLEEVVNPLPLTAEDRQCPTCQGERTSITPETTRVVELVPARIVVRVDVQQKVVCKACDAHVKRAEPGARVVAGGWYGPCLVATLLTAKFDDGVPLHRSRDQFLRLGYNMPYSTIVSQVELASDVLEPLWRCLKAQVLKSKVMHLDATSMPVLVKDLGRVGYGALWGMAGVSGVQRVAAFTYCSTGAARGVRRDPSSGELREEGPLDLLDKRSGYVVLDAATMYETAFKRTALTEVGCNMHARRYYVKAKDSGDVRAAHPIEAFQALYFIEAGLAGKSREEIADARHTRAKPIYAALLSWARAMKSREPPKSSLARAVSYQLGNEVALTRYLDDPDLPPDNGLVERLHRRPAIMRMNALFAGSHEGGRRAAIITSVTASCRLAGVNATAYLTDVIPRLQRGVAERELPALLPEAWKAERGSSSLLTVPHLPRFR